MIQKKKDKKQENKSGHDLITRATQIYKE